MSNKIFISYNHNDKQLIDTIARRLELEFGRNNIFYDAWSMQPGDSIIGKMNEGLSDFTTFFFFISPNSIKSKMVSLEWQTALNRAINNDLKFIGIRIADCNIPTILSDKLYIDLYGEGLDDAVSKMKSCVKSENVYKPLDDVQNLIASFREVTPKKIEITISALLYSEQNPVFAFACENPLNEFSVCFNISDGLTISGKDELTDDTQQVLYARTVQVQRALSPGFPFVFEVDLVNTSHLRNVAVYILVDGTRRMYKQIPTETVTS
ncbi:MAG: toll/interleukin-1 receptor domain-containing protein [Ruminococcus sp.]|nr:toll/interleukin-1 receptor domain-containing protein [Ruminococcus sp.]